MPETVSIQKKSQAPDPAEIPVFILCGGIGTRLRSVELGPKATVIVSGLPFLTYTLRLLERQGFRKIYLLAGFKAEVLASELGLRPDPDVLVPTITRNLVEALSIEVVPEDEPLGTGGAVAQAKTYASDFNLILNGDSYAEIRYMDLFSGVSSELSRLLGVWKFKCGDYGSLSLDGEDRVLQFLEKGHAKEGWINGGVYAVSRSFFERLPEGASSLETDVLPKEAEAGRLAAKRYQCFFRDIGTPDRFRQAQAEFAVLCRRIRDERVENEEHSG